MTLITPLVDSILHRVQPWLLHSLDMILHCLGPRSAIQAYSCTRHPTLEGNVENQVGNSFFVLSIYGFDIEMSLKLKVTYCKFHSVEGFSLGTK